MRTLATAALLALSLPLSACNPIEGVWVLTLTPITGGDATITCDHNYFDAACEDFVGTSTSEWSTGTTRTYEPITVLAQVLDLGGGQKGLQIGGEVLVGENVEGAWQFALLVETGSSTNQSHQAGFDLSEASNASADHLLHLGKPEGDVRVGRLSSDVASSSSWFETDEWNANDVGRGWSSIPASNYLYKTEGNGQVDNNQSNDDCSGVDCQLSIELSGTVEWDVSARRVKTMDPDNVIQDESDNFNLPRPGDVYSNPGGTGYTYYDYYYEYYGYGGYY